MQYSFNLKGDDFVYAQAYDINASYKHLGAACDAIRYARADRALTILDKVIMMERAIPFRRHNKHMGSRSELGGKKGAYPVKAATEVRKALINAIANAVNNAKNGDEMFVVHASANKTHIENRYPSKGSIAWGRGMYGRSAMNHSNLEYAKIEIVLAEKDSKELTKSMKYFINRKEGETRSIIPSTKTYAAKQVKKQEPKKAADQKPKTVEKERKPEEAKAIATPKKDLPKTEQKPAPKAEPKAEKPEAQTQQKSA